MHGQTSDRTIPEYGARVTIEGQASLYIREKALDAIEEQTLDDLNRALRMLDGRDVLPGTERSAIIGLQDELRDALDLSEVLAEIALQKQPLESPSS